VIAPRLPPCSFAIDDKAADGDGVADFIVADPCWWDDTGTSRAWLVSGKTMRVLLDPFRAEDADEVMQILAGAGVPCGACPDG
jgi:hypothetical protein